MSNEKETSDTNISFDNLDPCATYKIAIGVIYDELGTKYRSKVTNATTEYAGLLFFSNGKFYD